MHRRSSSGQVCLPTLSIKRLSSVGEVMAERVKVSFAGPGAGVEELSWGQREIWQAMLSQGSWFPIGGVRRLPPGTTVDVVAGRLRYIMERYQSARTRLRLATDPVDGN